MIVYDSDRPWVNIVCRNACFIIPVRNWRAPLKLDVLFCQKDGNVLVFE